MTDVRQQLGSVLVDPLHAFDEAGQLRDDLGPVDRDRAQRQQPDERADLEPRRELSGDAQHVVEEAVLWVPQRIGAVTRLAVHGGGDRDDVLVELDRHLLVGRIDYRQLERDIEHDLRVERHPRRSVRLLQVAAGGQR